MYSEPWETISCESFGDVRFDLGPLLLGQTMLNIKVLVYCLLVVLEVCSVKPPFRKSLAANLMVVSDLILDHSFKVRIWRDT